MMFYYTFNHSSHFKLHQMSQLAWFGVFHILLFLEYFVPFDHFAAFWFPLILISEHTQGSPRSPGPTLSPKDCQLQVNSGLKV